MSNERTVDAKAGESQAQRYEDASPGQTRRSFLGRSGTRALYLTPIVLSLAARQAKAASGASGASAG